MQGRWKPRLKISSSTKAVMPMFVWYAGHGHTDDSGEGYLIPIDGVLVRERRKFLRTALSLRRFGEFVHFAEFKHVFTAFDSCFAGTIFDVARAAPQP